MSPLDGTTYPASLPPPETIERQRLRQLRDRLLSIPAELFDMRSLGSTDQAGLGECHTPACIGGWARALFGRRGEVQSLDYYGPLLGLSEEQAHRLFFPNAAEQRLMDAIPYNITSHQAATLLSHVLETGEVDWSILRAKET